MTRMSSKAVAPASSPQAQRTAGYKQWLALLICASLATSSWPAYGQQDDLDKLFEDEEIDEPIGTFNQAPPPPPPPAPDFNVDNNPPPPEPTYNTGGGSNFSRGSSGPSTMTVTKTNKPGEKPQNPSIEDITDENYGDMIEANFPDVEINELVKAMGLLTNKNFIIDPGVRGKITILAPNKVTVAEAYKAFLAALAINGFTVVPYGKFYKIKSSRNAQRDSIETYTGEYAPTSDIYITRIVHLKHTSAEEVNKRLRVLPSKDGEITPYEPTNSLIITDYGANVERMMKIIKELDRPGFEEQLAVVPVRYAKSKDLADLINQIINKTPGSAANQNPAFGAAVPRFRSRGGTAAGGTPEELSLVAPDDRTNALIVVGNKAGIDKVRELIRKLDYKLDPAEAGGVFVYYVRYGEAEKIAATISNLSGGSAGNTAQAALQPPGVFGARPASPLDRQNIFGGDVRIVADKNTNSLVITASKQDYEVVRSLLAKIDIPRDQVFVEAIIMEMNTDKTKAWNPTYYYLDPASGGIGRAGFSRRGTLQNILNPTTDSGAILGFGNGATLNFNVGGQTVRVPSLVSFINLLQQNVESNILSTPKIMALDNEEAVIEVGDNVPIAQDQATTGQTITTNTRFEKATIKLTLTPYIRPDSDVVRLKLEQSVKQPSNTNIRSARLAESTTIISDRFIKTNIVVNSADTAVLGGLIRDEDTVDETKIPVLGDVPVLGWLFKSRSVQKKKINLVIFITPRIIRGVGDSQRLLGEKANERIDWVKRNFDGRDPYGAAMDKLPRTSKTDSDRDFPKKTNTDEPVGVKR